MAQTTMHCYDDAQQIEDYNDEFLSYVNGIRSSGVNCGGTWMPPVDPVRYEESLLLGSLSHSFNMAGHGFFDHTDPFSGSGPADRQEGIYGSRCVGENITAGSRRRTPWQAFNGLKDSPGHCRNMMDPRYDHMAVGCAYNAGSRYSYYWTMNLGWKGNCR